MYIISE